MRVLLLLVAVAGCYRESSTATPVVTNASDPALLADDASCRGGDDLDNRVDDVFPEGRLRSHRVGSLAGAGGREWRGLKLPDTVPETIGTLEIFLADGTDEGFLVFYRDPYGLSSCSLGSKQNCAYEAALYTYEGKREWSLPLAPLMSRPDGLEVQDIRYSRGVLYFNEACQSYSSEQGGKCSSLVAVDPFAKKVLWRTPSLVSNGRFAVRGCYIVAGYGFTSEPDHVSLVEKSTGKVVQKIAVSSAPQTYKLDKDRLDITLYAGGTRRYKLEGIETRSGRLVDLDGPEAIYGGAGYGGAAYGGYGYGGAMYGGHTYGSKHGPRGKPRLP
jgi:hypothetical protein